MEQFSNLPEPVKWTTGGVAAGGLVAMGVFLSSGKWIFLLALLLLVVLLVGGYFLVAAWRRKKRNARLGGELAQHTSASPRGISDPGQRARLDDLPQQLEQCGRAYRSSATGRNPSPSPVTAADPGSRAR